MDGSWPRTRPNVVQRRPDTTAIRTYLLDADDDLAAEFDVRTRHAVRQGTTVKVLQAAVGECALEPSFEDVGSGFGLLILEGLIVLDVEVGDRIATELIGAGDLLQPYAHLADEMLRRTASWRVLTPARLALLDTEFAERVRPWPQIVRALLRRAVRRTSNVDTMRAITCHPRLEVRLDLLMWHLAARWGRVEPSGIRLTLPLTHRVLGQMVSAERPSISHALSRLAHAGLITGDPGDWHLHGSLESHLSALAERGVSDTGLTRAAQL
jgi:CRP-like cAMP-binding protein